jgi:hypothetical protein
MPKRGGSRGRKKLSLSDLSREAVTEADFPELLNELINGTDRSAALVGCSILDTTLIYVMGTRMTAQTQADVERLFFSADAPLATFSAKIRVAKALGLYQSRVETALNLVRRIRNVFAHSAKPLPFNHPLIEAELLAIQDDIYLEPRWFAERGFDVSKVSPQRAKFIAICFYLVQILETVADANKGREIAQGWLDGPPTSPEIPGPQPLQSDQTQD